MNTDTFDIAVIGLAGRFPQASDLKSFWEMLKNGKEAVVGFSDEDMLTAGVSPDLIKHPDYVRSGTFMDEIENFDAGFFNISIRDAEITDPQQRLFLECSWQALEHAGYPPETTKDRIGLYAGISDNTYMRYHLEPNMQELLTTVGSYRINTVNGKDFIATRTAYKLNLKGPAMTIQTACSTSLVAVHVACQSLLNMECDMALAGGVSVRLPQKKGYLYQDGLISSPDGHCRAFDAQAKGTISGSGVGVVMLKRMEDAIADGDTVHAVIRGSAVNNDGSDKIGYTAPSVNGQASVISEALSVAGVHPDEVSYIETHGTGTPLGDPIEVEALTQAFRIKTERKTYCALGSVKTNIGHADTAAGIAGLIKTILSLKYRMLPPSLHYKEPNPQIDFTNSPFYVNNKLKHWEMPENVLRCAGVSSFGIGGTNAHVVVAEAPPVEPGSPSRSLQLLTLSAKTKSALESAKNNMASFLGKNKDVCLPDVAFTLNKGRQSFKHRTLLACSDHDDAIRQLSNAGGLPFYESQESTDKPVFLFPGQGSQYLNMTKELYDNEPVFRESVDNCAQLLTPCLGEDIRHIIYSDNEENQVKLKQTAYTQPALFVVEYSLACLWMSWGISPKAMIGHSIGEYVAACLAGVFSLEDALSIVTERGRLIQSLPSGAMLAVPLPEETIIPMLTPDLSLSVINSKDRCIVGGPHEAIHTFEKGLQEQGIACRTLHTSHAFHSRMMDPVLDSFARKLQQIRLNKPTLPFLSNHTGNWANPEEVTNPDYWVKHLRHTVRFADALTTLFQQEYSTLLEVGPGQTLSSLAQRHPQYSEKNTVLYSMPLRRKTGNNEETKQILLTLGQLWAKNAGVNWDAFYSEEKRHRIPLPTYPFERKRYWIDSPREKLRNKNKKDWLYQPVWQKKPLPETGIEKTHIKWVLFEDNEGICQELYKHLTQKGDTVTVVRSGNSFGQKKEGVFFINPEQATDYDQLVKALLQGEFPGHFVHCQGISKEAYTPGIRTNNPDIKDFYSVLYLVQALSKNNVSGSLNLTIISNRMQAVTDTDTVLPEKACLTGAIKTIEKEFDNINCRSIDIDLDSENNINLLLSELQNPEKDQVVAYRAGQRRVQTYQPLEWDPGKTVKRLRHHGVYLITGGMGGIGLTLAEYLATDYKARLILTGRSPFPEKNEWEHWLKEHDEDHPVSRKIQQLQSFERAGAEIMVYRTDISDEIQTQTMINAVRQHYGTINGVIHAAGVPDGALIANRDTKTTEQVLAPKIKGTVILDKLLSEFQPDFFVLCSSLSSVLGATGQIAYCAANAFQDAYAQANRNHAQTLFAAINWDTWQKVGMAVEAVRNSINRTKKSTAPEKTGHPLFGEYKSEGKQTHYISHISDKLWILNNHRIFGKESAVMPGTAYLQWAKSALAYHLKNSGISSESILLKDVYFLQPMAIENGETKTLYTTLAPVSDGFEFVISSRGQEHARGLAKAISPEPAQTTVSIGNIRNRCREKTRYAGSDLTKKAPEERNALENALALFGPHWHNLREIHYGNNEALAYLELSGNVTETLDDFPLHPGLLDMATGFWGLGEDKTGNKRSLPFSYESIRIYKPLAPRIYSHARLKNTKESENIPILDITILDEQGNILIEITGYTFREVKDSLSGHSHLQNRNNTPPGRNNTELETEMEQRLGHGLLPSEGVEVFKQALKHNKPQVLVSKQDLSTQFEQKHKLHDTTDVTIPDKEKAQRPALTTPYVAPGTSLEKKMAEAWQKFLRIEPIGLNDDFFDLGGDSLLAVQLASYLRTKLSINLGTQSLLNTPTIAGLSNLLQTDKQSTDSSEPELLINLKTGKHPPLIMVHPVGGNVVHYRKFARFLETGQAIYAIRAIGIDGKNTPLVKIEKMAEQYIREIKKLQPEGPYLLGGYSMGGSIAYEMAQQLTQQGDEVAMLIMIDAGWPGSVVKYGPGEETNVMADMYELSKGIRISTDELLNMDDEIRWKWFVEKLEGDTSPESRERTRNFMKVFRANTTAMADYKPRAWKGEAIFFRATEYSDNPVIPEKEWGKLIQGNMKLCRIPGNHVSMMNEDAHVQEIVKIIQPAIIKTVEKQLEIQSTDEKHS